MTPGSTVIPCLRYRDAPAAIEWLCRAFGFEKQAVHTDPADARVVLHAQLTLGRSGMVMLGSVRTEGHYHRLMRQPEPSGEGSTQSVNLVVPDADALCMPPPAPPAPTC